MAVLSEADCRRALSGLLNESDINNPRSSEALAHQRRLARLYAGFVGGTEHLSIDESTQGQPMTNESSVRREKMGKIEAELGKALGVDGTAVSANIEARIRADQAGLRAPRIHRPGRALDIKRK